MFLLEVRHLYAHKIVIDVWVTVWASGRRKEQAKVWRHCPFLGFSDAVDQSV